MPKISLSLSLLNDNNLLASSFEDNTIRFANMNATSLKDIKFNDSIILKGHTHFIKVITALNKTILASGSCDNTIILWDIISFKQINNLTGHTGCINALISVPYVDSTNLLISGSSDSKIKVWQSNGKELKNTNGNDYFENNKPVNALAYGTIDYSAYIAIASDENKVKIWSYNDFIYEKQIINITDIKFLTIINNTLIVTVNSLNNSLDKIKVWNDTSVEPIFAFNSTKINTIKVLLNGNLAIGTKMLVNIYDLNFKIIQRLNHSFEVKLMDASAKNLIVANPDIKNDKTELTIWDLETCESKKNAILRGEIIIITILSNENIVALSYSKNYLLYIFDHTITQIFFKEDENRFDSLIELRKYRNNLAIGSSSIGLIEIWDIESKSLNKSLHTKNPVESLIEFKKFLISGHKDRSIIVWDLNLFIIKAEIRSEHKNKILFYSILQLGDLNLISFSNDSLFKWSFREKLRINSNDDLTKNIQNPITVLLFFSNQKLLGGSADSIIHVWDNHFIYKESLKRHEKQITCLISLNSYLFASASEDNIINIWSEDNPKPNQLSKSHNSKINSLVYDSNLNMIISGSMDGQIIIWQNTTQLTFKEELIGHTKQIEHLIYLDKDVIASASDDNTILIWNKSKIEFNLTNHTDSIYALTKLTNGNLASCSKDKTIRIWDKNNNFSLISTLYGHLRSVICIKSIDEQRLVSGSCDKKIIVWNITSNYIIKEINEAHSDCINTLTIYQGYLLSGSDDKEVKIWNLTNFISINKTINQVNSIKKIAYNSKINNLIALNGGNNFNLYKNDSKYNMISNLTGHTSFVKALAVIPSNENIVSGSNDATIKVWNSKTLQLIANLTGHTSFVNALVIIPSNENIVSGSNDATIKVWNSKTLQLIANLTGHTNYVNALVIIPSNENIVSGSDDATIRVWNSKTFQLIANLALRTSYVNALAIIPSNENIVSGSNDATIKVWNSKTFQLIANLTGHTNYVNALVIIPSNENIVSGSDDATIRVWNSKTFQLIANLTGHTDWVVSLSIITLNENIVSGSFDKTIKVWNSETFQLIANLEGHVNSVNALVIIPSNENIVSGLVNGGISFWSIKFELNFLRSCITKKSNNLQTNLEFSGKINTLAIIPSNENIVSGSDDATIRVWNSKTFHLIATLRGHTDWVNALVIIPSNENIVSGSDDSTIKVWNSKTFQLIANLTGHTNYVNALVIIPSNENIVSGSNDETIKIWNSKTFHLIANLAGHTYFIFALAIIPSNENIVSGSNDKSIKIWNSKTFHLIANLSGYTRSFNTLVIIPSNENVVAGSDDSTIKILNSKTFQLITNLTGHKGYVYALAIISTNENIVSGSSDETIKVWNSKTFQLLSNLRGHTNWVISLILIPSNLNIVSGSFDKTIKLWKNLYTSNIDKNDEILDLLFLSNYHLATSSLDGTLRVWNIYTCEIISNLTNDIIRKHASLDYDSYNGDLAHSEAKLINIYNAGFIYFNVSNVN
jgi:WD40 repeat protein